MKTYLIERDLWACYPFQCFYIPGTKLVKCLEVRTVYIHFQGAVILEGSTGCSALKTPFCRPFFSSGNPPFWSTFPAPETQLLFFQKKCIFKPNFCWFWLDFSSCNTNFSKNSFRRPHFQAKKSVPETLLLKTWAAHCPTQNCFFQLPNSQVTISAKFSNPLPLPHNTWGFATLPLVPPLSRSSKLWMRGGGVVTNPSCHFTQ